MTDYTPGQVWSFRGRPQDVNPRVKIQMVEHDPSGELVFHVSVTGLAFANPHVPGEIAHAPVSRETLDASVVAIAEPDPEAPAFPDPAEGVASWKEGEGGVFTISLAELAQVFDQVTADFVPNAGEHLYFMTEWRHERPGEPVWVMYEVDREGNVLRTIHGFADGSGALTALEDVEDEGGRAPVNLAIESFFEIWKDVPMGVPHGDSEGEHVVLTERPRAEFETIWRENRG